MISATPVGMNNVQDSPTSHIAQAVVGMDDLSMKAGLNLSPLSTLTCPRRSNEASFNVVLLALT